MSRGRRFRISPPLRRLSPAQQTAVHVLGQKLSATYAPVTAQTYQRWFKAFLHLSRLFEHSFDTNDQAPIQPFHWFQFECGLRASGVDNPEERLGRVRQALQACFPKQALPSARITTPLLQKPKRVSLSVPRENLPTSGDRALVSYLENTARLHRADDYRRFLGRIKRACPTLLTLPPEQRFLACNMAHHMDAILADATKLGQYQRLHLLADGLNGFFKCQDFSWFHDAVLERRDRLIPPKWSKAVAVKSRKRPFNAGDMRKEPFLSILDQGVPTLETPKSRIGNVRPVAKTSRRLYEVDFMHLVNARMEARIGSLNDDAKAYFSQASIRALQARLPWHMAYRTAGKMLVRLRRLYWRLFGDDQSVEYEFMTMVGRRFFKTGTPLRKSLDHLDAGELLGLIEERVKFFGEKLEQTGNIARSFELIEYRNLLIFALLLSTGLRLSNVAHLQRNETVKMGTKTIVSIPSSKVKNKIRIEFVLLDWLAEHIERYQSIPLFGPNRTETIWQTRNGALQGVDAVRRSVKEISKQLVGQALTPHQLRHLFADYLQKQPEMNTEQLKRLMAHHTPVTTFRDYRAGPRPYFQDVFDFLLADAAA